MKEDDWRKEIEAFVDACGEQQNARKYVTLAIDPGGSGAIGLLCGDAATAVDIPVTVTRVRKQKSTTAKERSATGRKSKTVNSENRCFDYQAICELFSELSPLRSRVRVLLEKPPPTMSNKFSKGKKFVNPAADAKLARAYAMWPLFLFDRGFALEEVTPSVWKKVMGLQGQDKEASRQAAIAMFPDAAHRLSRKSCDTDRAEALLIAEYARRTRKRK